MKGSDRREVVAITGASAGLGRATARAFARRGACIGLLARGRERLETTRDEIEQLGGRALVLPADELERTLGSIDIWVNNAMTSVFSAFRDMTAEEYRRVTEVTYLGSVYGTMAALRRMLPRDHGTIVQVGSALSMRSIPLQSAYCGAKAAIRGFTDSIRCELLHEKSRVHITMVQMPALNTPQFGWVRSRLPRKSQPVPPIFQPEVGADAIVWASRHRKREVYVGGSTVQAIWGNKLIAGLLDRYFGYKGFDAQMTNEPEDPNRPDDLWSSVPGDPGAHGAFDARAKSHSLQWQANRNKGWIGLGAVALGVLTAEAMRRDRNNGRIPVKT